MLFNSLVRPILESNNKICRRRFKAIETKLESMQRQATKVVPGLINLSYLDPLQAVKLSRFTFCRMQGVMIQVFKYLYKYKEFVTNWNTSH